MMLDAEVKAEIEAGPAFIEQAPKLMEILDAVASVYRVGKMDMMSLRRFPHMVEARDAFYWLARHLTPRTYVEIGRFFADRDHSTVLEGVSRATLRFPTHKARLAEVCKRLNVKANIEGL